MTQQQQKEYTWDDLVAAVGQDFSGGAEVVGAEPCERSAIRRFCEPLEMDNPIHYDEEAAKAAGYRGVVAPVSMINNTLARQTYWKPGDPSVWPKKGTHETAQMAVPLMPRVPAPPTTAGFATELELEYIEPVCVGDLLTKKGRKLVSVNVRETSVGFGAFLVFQSEIYNQRGELVARELAGTYMYNPHSPEKLEELRKRRGS